MIWGRCALTVSPFGYKRREAVTRQLFSHHFYGGKSDCFKDGFFKENGIINVHPVYENWQDASSSIYTTAFTLPLLVKQRFSKNFAVSLGAQLNWNFYSRVNNEYEIGDDDFDVNTKKMGAPIAILGLAGKGAHTANERLPLASMQETADFFGNFQVNIGPRVFCDGNCPDIFILF